MSVIEEDVEVLGETEDEDAPDPGGFMQEMLQASAEDDSWSVPADQVDGSEYDGGTDDEPQDEQEEEDKAANKLLAAKLEEHYVQKWLNEHDKITWEDLEEEREKAASLLTGWQKIWNHACPVKEFAISYGHLQPTSSKSTA